jgi:rRNA maturation endonuclease Nob1
MEGINREVADPNAGGEQTNFDGKLNDSVKDRVKGVASSVKGKASAIPSMIADGLEAGAEALRQRKTSTSVVTTGGSSVTVADDSSIAAVTDTLASGMQSSAEWLRDADIDKLKQGVEKQVKEHPARSLLVALGAGYLIGKALRR